MFNDQLPDTDAWSPAGNLSTIVCVMRERTPMTHAVTARLPKLRLIAATVMQNASIDQGAAAERGIEVASSIPLSS